MEPDKLSLIYKFIEDLTNRSYSLQTDLVLHDSYLFSDMLSQRPEKSIQDVVENLREQTVNHAQQVELIQNELKELKNLISKLFTNNGRNKMDARVFSNNLISYPNDSSKILPKFVRNLEQPTSKSIIQSSSSSTGNQSAHLQPVGPAAFDGKFIQIDYSQGSFISKIQIRASKDLIPSQKPSSELSAPVQIYKQFNWINNDAKCISESDQLGDQITNEPLGTNKNIDVSSILEGFGKPKTPIALRNRVNEEFERLEKILMEVLLQTENFSAVEIENKISGNSIESSDKYSDTSEHAYKSSEPNSSSVDDDSYEIASESEVNELESNDESYFESCDEKFDSSDVEGDYVIEGDNVIDGSTERKESTISYFDEVCEESSSEYIRRLENGDSKENSSDLNEDVDKNLTNIPLNLKVNKTSGNIVPILNDKTELSREHRDIEILEEYSKFRDSRSFGNWNLADNETRLNDNYIDARMASAVEKVSNDKEIGICAFCTNIALKRCGNCRQVFYCKKQCQKSDWKKGHKEDCRPVQQMENSELGRYLVATRDLKAGDTIFKEEAIVVGPMQIIEPVCLGCYKKVHGSYRCSKCTWPLCGAGCENTSEHQPECVIGQEIGSPIQIENFNETNHFYEVVTTLRCLTLKKRSPRKYEQLMSLESHYEDRKGTTIFDENKKRIVNMLRNYFMLVDYPPEILDSSEHTIHKITGILDVNALEIQLEHAVIWGLFPNFSMIEHSCIPNTKHTFNSKKQVTCRAAVDIKQGEHLSTMYTHILWGTLARREHLKINKYFMCMCRRCADPTELGTHFSDLRCQSCSSLGYLYSAAPLDELAYWICSNCNETLPVDKVREMTLKLGEDVEDAVSEPTIYSLEKFIAEKEATTVHSNHFNLFAAKHSLLQLYGRDGIITEEIMKKKEKLCQEFLKICNTLDPGMAQLTVYASVALYEFHIAIMSRPRISPDGSPMNPAIIRKDIEIAKALLRQCIKMLDYENPDLPEGQLSKTARANLKELEEWQTTLL